MKTFFIESNLPLFPIPYVDQLDKYPFKYGLQVQAESVREADKVMNKQYQFTFSIRSPFDPIRVIHHDTVESDDLVELASKFLLSVLRGQAVLEDHKESHKTYDDDDIPF